MKLTLHKRDGSTIDLTPDTDRYTIDPAAIAQAFDVPPHICGFAKPPLSARLRHLWRRLTPVILVRRARLEWLEDVASTDEDA